MFTSLFHRVRLLSLLFAPLLLSLLVQDATCFQSVSPFSSSATSKTFPSAAAPKTRLSAEAALTASGGASEEPDKNGVGGGKATIPDEIFNLVKSIVGAGVLSLPSGIAAYGNAPSAVLPAVALITVIGGLSGYGFALIGRVCALTSTKTYRQAWKATVSEESSWIPAWSVTLKTCFAVLAYSMILADTFTSLLSAAKLPVTLTKNMVLAVITSAVLLPLCLLKDLSSLAPFSLLGTMGMLYTAVAMTVRYLSKAYVGTGRFAADLAPHLRPAFGTAGASAAANAKIGILVGMLSTAYMAHFNAPKFYTELKDNTIPRYVTVVGSSFAISIGIFAVMAAAGFLTFGGNSAGLILNNYSNRDTLMAVSRIAVGLSLVFSYPLAFTGAREGILDLFQIKNRSPKFLNTLTVGLLAGITGLACIIPDVSFVLSFAGATLGNALIYIYPALMFRGAIKKLPNPTKTQKFEVKLALTSATLGLVMGVIGAVKAVQSIL